MTFAKPATKAGQVIAELSQYLLGGNNTTQFALARYRRDLMSSMNADASEAYAGLGMIAVLEWDEAGMRRNFENAIKLDNEYTVHANYAVCLNRLGLISEAAEQYRIAYELSPTDINAAKSSALASLIAGEVHTALELSERAKKLSPNKNIPELESPYKMLKVFSKTGVDESLVKSCNKVAYELLRENKIFPRVVVTEIDLEDNIVLSTIYISRSPSEVKKLDSLLGQRLDEQITNYNPTTYWVGYSHKSAS